MAAMIKLAASCNTMRSMLAPSVFTGELDNTMIGKCQIYKLYDRTPIQRSDLQPMKFPTRLAECTSTAITAAVINDNFRKPPR